MYSGEGLSQHPTLRVGHITILMYLYVNITMFSFNKIYLTQNVHEHDTEGENPVKKDKLEQTDYCGG